MHFTVTIRVPSISCNSCIAAITRAIQALDAKAEVRGDVERKVIEVTTAVSLDRIKQAIMDAGHDVVD
ncbi:MAG: heavy-metal-associated domain-containing protein [Geminocystis sp.]|nr:heavy-metal-associated domain-containing protein [Geminocystis sp.]HIK36475.1 heavy-metal-associated domain-containing protein [Geminocystis sp. M7585_C2015_104]MCS7147587.1 heavy-metal-associated domain-containing protein [Geminocystis sp.]MCX8077990.1 heavy-metal-associated domain-containing protein [Geminocystis sp.]MDW8115280.1 heavy-metal-associated domain-containing protein [Geminocystis sp.]